MQLPITMPTSDVEEESQYIDKKMKDLKKMIYNFKMQRSEILLRIGTIYRKAEEEPEKNKCKAYDQSSTAKRRARTYGELETVLKELSKVQPTDKNNIIEILFCCNGVKLYYIESNSEVVSSLEDFALRIVRLGCDFEKNLDETIFLQLIKATDSAIDIGHETTEHNGESNEENASGGVYNELQVDPSFIYPLIPGVSPCFRTKFNAFILPDLQSNDGSAIGLIIPEEFDEFVLDILIQILKGIVKDDGGVEFGDFTQIGQIIPQSTGDKVSENIVTGAHWISFGLMKTAEKTGELLDFSTPYILSKIQKAPEDAPPVSESVRIFLKILNHSVNEIINISGSKQRCRC